MSEDGQFIQRRKRLTGKTFYAEAEGNRVKTADGFRELAEKTTFILFYREKIFCPIPDNFFRKLSGFGQLPKSCLSHPGAGSEG